VEVKVFFIFLLLDGRIRIRNRSWIRTNKLRIRMRIQEAQNHTAPTDPHPDADPEHCKINTVLLIGMLTAQLHYVNIIFFILRP
jgi:hypothetical protein